MMDFINFYPIINRIVGLTLPGPNLFDGQDMLEVIRGKNLLPKRDLFSYVAQGRPEQAAICDGTWKLVIQGGSALEVNLDDIRRAKSVKDKISVELFHLDRDPGEKTDLIREHPKIAAELLKRLKEFLRERIEGMPHYDEGREGFKAPKDWIIRDF